MVKVDIARHCDPSNVNSFHNKNTLAIKACSKNNFDSQSYNTFNSVIGAEMLHVNLIVRYNLLLALSGHLMKNYPQN